MNTYYARHNAGLLVDKPTKQRVHDENLIAVHYPADRNGDDGPMDNRSVNPSDYSRKAKEIIQTLNTLSQNGGYVCVEYQDQQRTKVGVVPSNSSIRLMEGRYQDSSRVAILKTLKIERVRQLDSWTAIRILAGRPQRHSLCMWSAVGDRIKHLVEGTEAIRTVSDLLPAEQEILCSEFLRLSIAEEMGLPRLASLLSPIGRTMKDLDIVGIDLLGHVLACQVTHGQPEYAPVKLETLRRYSDKSRCVPILFCMSDRNYTDGDVHVVSLQRVFAQFAITDIGRTWLANLSLPTAAPLS